MGKCTKVLMCNCSAIHILSNRCQCCSAADLGLESLLIIQELCGPSCQPGYALQESPAGSGTKAQAKASTEVILHIKYLSQIKRNVKNATTIT